MMNRPYSRSLLFFCFLLLSCALFAQSIRFEPGEGGLWIKEGDQALMFFHSEMNDALPAYARMNYFHPVYDLNGQCITEDFPADHPHQRGIFWAWHQLLVNGTSLGDAWHLKLMTQHVDDLSFATTKDGCGVLNYASFWHSSVAEQNPFLKEQNTVLIHPVNGDGRRIDFSISLMPLVDGFALGGSKDIKGYGGFSLRLRTDQESVFFLDSLNVEPQQTAIVGGHALTISLPQLNTCVTLMDKTSHSNESRWILRQVNSMQNCAWPGAQAVCIPKGQVIELNYTLLIHSCASASCSD